MITISHSLDKSRRVSAPLGAALAAVFALAPGMLMAAPPSGTSTEVVSAKVSLTDLDLTTTRGQRAAKDRLSAAAHRLCHKFSDGLKAADRATMEDCYRETLETSLQQLSAQVTVAASKGSQLAQNRP
jgi:UrcA family protein